MATTMAAWAVASATAMVLAMVLAMEATNMAGTAHAAVEDIGSLAATEEPCTQSCTRRRTFRSLSSR